VPMLPSHGCKDSPSNPNQSSKLGTRLSSLLLGNSDAVVMGFKARGDGLGSGRKLGWH
jgi:hypothetical protein